MKDSAGNNKEKKILTRIFIKEDGDLLVTDMWEEIHKDLIQESGGSFSEAD